MELRSAVKRSALPTHRESKSLHLDHLQGRILLILDHRRGGQTLRLNTMLGLLQSKDHRLSDTHLSEETKVTSLTKLAQNLLPTMTVDSTIRAPRFLKLILKKKPLEELSQNTKLQIRGKESLNYYLTGYILSLKPVP